MARYGTEKPDLRVGLEIVDVTVVVAGTGVPGLPGRRGAGVVRPRRGRPRTGTPRRAVDRPRPGARRGRVVWLRVGADAQTLDSPVRRFLSDDEARGLVTAFGAQPGDLLLLVAGPGADVRSRSSVTSASRWRTPPTSRRWR